MLSGPKSKLSRQLSVSQLNEVDEEQEEMIMNKKKTNNVKQKKSNRAQRCKSLLLLSSPFSSSNSNNSVKSSFLSLWPAHSNLEKSRVLAQSSVDLIMNSSSTGSSFSKEEEEESEQQLAPGQRVNSNNNVISKNKKCVKMKLFEQPLDKLFNQKAMKQLNGAITSSTNNLNSISGGGSTNNINSISFSANHRLAAGGCKRKRRQTGASYQTSAHLRRFTSVSLDLNNNTNNNTDRERDLGRSQQNLASNNDRLSEGIIFCGSSERQKLLLACLPLPIRNLLNELYLRGPQTIGIFRKSPNAKHCKELRHKLEQDSQSSIEQFQVPVIASVFKEWLRSLPDCLLMSRLYPQWIAVAKLIEPLYGQQQQPHHLLPSSQSLDCGTNRSNSGPRPSPLTDNEAGEVTCRQPDCNRQREQNQNSSCSNPDSDSPRGKLSPGSNLEPSSRNLDPACDNNDDANKQLNARSPNEWSCESMESDPKSRAAGRKQQEDSSLSLKQSAFALSERHNECLRIVGQLLDALNEANLILLRSFICVLWHIAEESDFNKMSANNLGVCVGQSLLNDEHQSSSDKSPQTNNNHNQLLNSGSSSNGNQQSAASGSASTFIKRHRRSRSQCLISSTLSLISNGSSNSNSYLDSSGAQETAKYVPMLVAFMIENAEHLFGRDVTKMFASLSSNKHEESSSKLSPVGSSIAADRDTDKRPGELEEDPSLSLLNSSTSSNSLSLSVNSSVATLNGNQRAIDHIDSGATDVDSGEAEKQPPVVTPKEQQAANKTPVKRQEILIGGGGRRLIGGQAAGVDQRTFNSQRQVAASSGSRDSPEVAGQVAKGEQDTTSILIVDQRVAAAAAKSQQLDSKRPLSVSESTSSSQTSGLHSSSPAFSSEEAESGSSGSSSGVSSRGRSDDSGGHLMATNTTCSPSSMSSPSLVSSSGSSSPASPVNSSGGCGGQQQQQLPVTATARHSLPVNSLAQDQENRDPAKGLRRTAQERLQQTARRFSQQQSAQYRGGSSHEYSTFEGLLSRPVPRLPVQLGTSSYGGETIIYNPRPRARNSTTGSGSSTSSSSSSNGSSNNEPIYSNSSLYLHQNHHQPMTSSPVISAALSYQTQAAATAGGAQYHSIASLQQQQELRQQRLNEFLAHRSSQLQLSAAPSLPYLPTNAAAPNYATAHRRPHINQYVDGYGDPSTGATLRQHPNVYYSTNNLNSLQYLSHQQQQQQLTDRYLFYQRVEPQRSHVMSLRDYYLSLHHQQQQQHPRPLGPNGTNQNNVKSSQRQQPNELPEAGGNYPPPQRHFQSGGITTQPLISSRQQQLILLAQGSSPDPRQPMSLGNLTAAHHSVTVQRPQTRLAKIRQNQFNHQIGGPEIYRQQQQQQQQQQTAASGTNLLQLPVPLQSQQKQQQKQQQQNKSIMSSSAASSDDHSSADDDSDEYLADWVESTMV